MSVLHVQTFGELRLTRATGEPVALRRKPLALLAFVARRAPRAVSRAELATLLWGDRTEERARQSLRQALLELKQAVGDAVEVSADGVRLVDGAVVLDLLEFERDAREGRFDAAAERWRGEFVPDAREVGGDGFEQWVESERVTSLGRLGTVMEHLVGGAELRADWDAAAACAARWAAAAPFDERAHARLVETLRMQGRAAEALDRHAEFVARLRGALDVEPSPEFRRLAGGLAEQVRTEAARRSRPSTAVRAPAIVGRGHELAELAGAWRAAGDGRPELVLVDGDGGSGKTRLCDEMVRIAREGADGAVVLRACGVATHEPLTTLRLLFAGLADAPGGAGASPEALAEVTRLVPALVESFPHLPPPIGDDAALRGALVQMLEAVSEEMPVLVVLDDAHLGDRASQQLLAGVASRLAGRVTMLIVGSMATRAPGGVLDTLFAVPGVLRMALRRLDPPEVAAMLDSMVTVAESDRARLAERVHVETRGTPLLVYELITALIDERLLLLDPAGTWRMSPSLEGRPLPLPATVCDRVAAELRPLSPHARTLLDTAAVLGTPVASVLIEAVAGLGPADAAAALRELVTRRFVREDASTGQLDFTHPVLGRVAYALLSPSERQERHARAAAEMTERELTVTAERSVLPYHMARAGTPRATPVVDEAAEPSAAAPATPERRAHRPLLLGVLALVAVLAAAGVWRFVPRPGAPSAAQADAERRRVVVGAFENRSGRPELDRARDIAVDWIVRGLDETGLVEVVGAGRDDIARRGAGSARVSDAELLASARAARAGTVVTGSLHQLGDSVEIEAMLVDARDGSLLRALPSVRASAANPLSGVDRMRHQVVGALAAMVDPNYDAGGGGVRAPPSYAAYLAFMRGEDAAASGSLNDAALAYREAAAADSTYSLPLLRLATASFGTAQCGRVDSVGQVLDRRRGMLSRTEGLYLERVRAFCRADWQAADVATRRLADLTPRSQYAQYAAASSALSVNRPRAALRRLLAMDQTRGWVPPEGRYWTARAMAHHMSGDAPALRALLDRMRGARRDFFTVSASVYAAGALGDAHEFERTAIELIAVGGRMEGGRLLLLIPALDELRAHGQRAAAAAIAARLATQVGTLVVPGATGDTARYAQGELLYRAGRVQEAGLLVTEMLPRHVGSTYIVGLAGRVAARQGDRAAAMRHSEALGRIVEAWEQGGAMFRQAQIAALLGDRARAVRLLQAAVARGVPHAIAVSTVYLGHAEHDLESVLGDHAIQALLRPRD